MWLLLTFPLSMIMYFIQSVNQQNHQMAFYHHLTRISFLVLEAMHTLLFGWLCILIFYKYSFCSKQHLSSFLSSTKYCKSEFLHLWFPLHSPRCFLAYSLILFMHFPWCLFFRNLLLYYAMPATLPWFALIFF